MHVLAQVCTAWAEILLTYAPFWSVADASRGGVSVKTALRRSASRPVHVWISMTDKQKARKAGWRVICQHINRWQSADIQWDYDSLGALERVEAPLLQKLRLASATKEGERTLELDLFRGSAPRLLELILRSVSLKRWDVSLLRGLRILELANIKNGGSSLGNLLDVLRCCSDLERLHIHSVIFAEDNPRIVKAELTPIYLPFLHWLAIRNASLETVALPVATTVRAPACRFWAFDYQGTPHQDVLQRAVAERLVSMFKIKPNGSMWMELRDEYILLCTEPVEVSGSLELS